MMIEPRFALSLCISCTAIVWLLLVLSAAINQASPLGFALVTICIGNTMFLYWRFKGIVWP